MNVHRLFFGPPVIVTCILFATRPCLAQFGDLIKHLPNETNSLFLINTDKVSKGDLAKEKNFEKRYEELRAERPPAMPPDAMRFILSAEMSNYSRTS